ncbi:unnamed protein product, partial [Mesorhabditis belari]|uniref:Ubiquitin-like domain-containing protein n=1 Tax=Mesorhabditis belari TaxID=2138241 RepID=A0AAF3J6D8_9BILA
MEPQAQIELFFRLQRDRDDVEVGDVTLGTFDAASKVKDLRDHIRTFLEVDPEYQVVYVNRDGRRLKQLEAVGDTLLKEAGVEHGDAIVVKHAKLETWEDYLEQVKKLEDKSEKEIRGESRWSSTKEANLREELLKISEDAAKSFKTLEKTRFFSAYIPFKRIRDENVNRTGFLLLHIEENWFLKAVQAYFEKGNPQASVTCEIVKGAGMQTACLVKLESDDKSIAQYYAKFTAGMKPDLSLKSKDLQSSIFDLREIFVYRLLSLIKVGSKEVHVIRDAAESGYVYLATKIIHDFWTRDGRSVDATMEGKGKDEKKWGAIDEASRKVMEAQLEILVWLLGLKDLGMENKANYGYVETQIPEGGLAYELKIVDFTVQAEKRACKKPDKQRINEYVTAWKIKDKIDEAYAKMKKDDHAIAKRFKEDHEAYEKEDSKKEVATKNLCKYVEDIKGRLKMVQSQGNESLKRKPASEGEGNNEKKEKKEEEGN